MSNNNEALPKADHDKILTDSVLLRADLTGSTSVEQPRAIILAGQPGAGKGGLKERARIELDGNVVAIDADELRSYHPKLSELQNDHPYKWSVKTDTDASLWARELSAAAMGDRKNMIIDTTLGNGDGAVKLVDLLRKQGYDVEIRAVAAHQLESELGVDRRFTQRLDDEGAGRYVTEDYRKQVYRDLPENLNKIKAETGSLSVSSTAKALNFTTAEQVHYHRVLP
jgi:predicted ABC-type ATPase